MMKNPSQSIGGGRTALGRSGSRGEKVLGYDIQSGTKCWVSSQATMGQSEDKKAAKSIEMLTDKHIPNEKYEDPEDRKNWRTVTKQETNI